MELGEVIAAGGKYVTISFEGSPEEEAVKTTFEDSNGYLSVLDLRGTGINLTEINFPYYDNETCKIYMDSNPISQVIRNENKYVYFTFEGEEASIEKEDLSYAFNTGGLVCGVDMSVFTGLKNIEGMNEDNDSGDITNLASSEITNASNAFKNSGLTKFNYEDYENCEKTEGIIDNCASLTELILDNCSDLNVVESAKTAAKKSNLEIFSADNVDILDALDLENTTNLKKFIYDGLGLLTFTNIPDLSEVTEFILEAPNNTDIESLTVGKSGGSLSNIELELPELKSLTVLSDILEKFVKGNCPSLAKIDFTTPALTYLDLSGTEKVSSKISSFNLNGNTALTYINLDYSKIEGLNLTSFTSMPYAEFVIIDKTTRKLIKGWEAKNCPNLKNVSLLMSQAHGLNDDFTLDNDSLDGCSALEQIIVVTNEEQELKGHETHYASVDFNNDVNYRGKSLEEWIEGGGSGLVTKQVTQAEYDALPDTKLTDGVLYEITDDMENASPDSFYSTEEKAIGVWIDGSTIYRKVYTGLALGTSSTVDAWMETGIVNTEIKMIINATTLRTDTKALYKRFEYCVNNTSGKVMYLNFAKAGLGGVFDILVLEYTKN